ncbi:MAG TPA: hypothetical protein VHH34_20655 [Pseudonocardiaceae bacterium]|nr:hypothetical protein [Pseudonocardiaceae bacterium]
MGALAAIVLLMASHELRKRVRPRGRHRTGRGEPLFQVQRNGRVRFHFEDLRRSAAPAAQRGERPELEHTVPDLEMTVPDLLGHGVPGQRPDH